MTFVPNKNFAKEFSKDSEYKQGLAKATLPAKDAARAFAPVREGNYRDGIKVLVAGDEVYLSGTDWKSGFIEYGTVDTPIFAPLRRGARAAGLRFVESDRK